MSKVITANEVCTKLLLNFNRMTMAATMQGGAANDAITRIDKECRYPTGATVADYRKLYNWNGLAATVNNIWPDECWALKPDVYETEDDVKTKFETRLNEIITKHNLWDVIWRADRASGIGRYGGIVIGLPGKTNLPAKTAKDMKEGELQDILYLTPYAEDSLSIVELDTNVESERFGLPTMYQVQYNSSIDGRVAKTDHYHWTRVVHLSDNIESSQLYAIPRMQQSLYYLLDAKKIGGSSAEMFWKGGFQGWAFEAYKELIEEGEIDAESVKKQITNYQEGLQRFLTLIGGQIKSLAPAIADPTNHLTQQIIMICITIGVPLRIFMGSEEGKLASGQDSGRWNKRVDRRNKIITEPRYIRPVIDRFNYLGICPYPTKSNGGTYIVEWKDLNTNTDIDQANISLKLTQALMQYVTSKAYMFFPLQKYLTVIMKFSDKSAESIIKAAGGEEGIKTAIKKFEEMDKKAAAPQGGGRVGKSKGKDTNRPKDTNPKN